MRKAQAKKLPLAPDPRYNDKLVTRFVNNIMWQGKKSTAYDIFYDAVEKVAKQTGEDGYEDWRKALGNVRPAVEVRSSRYIDQGFSPNLISIFTGLFGEKPWSM